MLGRINLGQAYSNGDPWELFLKDTYNRYKSYSLKAQKDNLTTYHERWLGQAAKYKSMAQRLPDEVGGPGFVEKANMLYSDLYAFKGFVNNYMESNWTDRQREINFESIHDIVVDLHKLGNDIQTVSGGISAIEADAGALADAARESITAEELEEITRKAGNDDYYFAQLKNALFMQKVIEQYEDHLPKEAYDYLKNQSSKINKELEDAAPTKIQQILETNFFSGILDWFEGPNMPLIIGGAGLAAVLLFMMAKR